jgi:diguanylate cyclase (GGDEF)-like protein
MTMDAYTLIIASGIAAAIMAMTMYLLYRASPRETSLLDWSLAGVFNLGSNAIGVAILGHHTGSFLAPAIANVFYIAGHYGILAGLRRHFGLAPRWNVVCLLSLAILGVHFSPFAQASVTHRLILFYPVIITMNILIIKLLWRAPDHEAKPAYRSLLVLEIAFLLQILCSFGLILSSNGGTLTPAGSQFLQTAGSLSTFIFLSVATMSCALVVIRHQEVALRKASLSDSLTGWLNRRALQDIAEREFLRSRRGHSPMSFMIFDIDHFKSVNDRYGHAIGDAAIRHVTQQAAHALRGYDGLFRIGGEEFAAIISDAPFEELQRIGERLRALIEAQPLMLNGRPVAITVSVGMASGEPADIRWEDILRRADDALYCAKQGGRNQVRLYHSDLAPVLAERSRFAAAA